MNREISNNVRSGGLPKKENQGVQRENEHLKAPRKYIEITWQQYRIAAFILFVLSFGAMKYIIDYFKQKTDDIELLSILKIISFFFILNFGTFLFITVYYKYRKSIKGVKGPTGRLGKRGHQGSSSYCNICEKKTGGYRREYNKIPQKEEVVSNVLLKFDNSPTKKWKQLKNTVTIGGKSFSIIIPSILGPGIKHSDEHNGQPDESVDNTGGKPIIGASASFNKDTGEIYTIMFLIDKNEVHNPKKYKYKPIHDTPFGFANKKGVGVEFRAPPNSAVNRIELFHNGDKIKSIRLYCADIKTGNPVDVLDPSSDKMKKFANIGAKVSRNDKTLNYEYVESRGIIVNKVYYPAFISAVKSYHNPTIGIFNLIFDKASIYEDGFSLNDQ